MIFLIEEEKIKKYQAYGRELAKLKEEDAVTMDGHHVGLEANIELPRDVDIALNQGAKGIGLFRTEFLYMNRVDLPSEEEHFHVYRRMAEKMAPFSVTIRTVDLGGDKFISQLDIPQEMNPFWAGERFAFVLNA